MYSFLCHQYIFFINPINRSIRYYDSDVFHLFKIARVSNQQHSVSFKRSTIEHAFIVANYHCTSSISLQSHSNVSSMYVQWTGQSNEGVIVMLFNGHGRRAGRPCGTLLFETKELSLPPPFLPIIKTLPPPNPDLCSLMGPTLLYPQALTFLELGQTFVLKKLR